MSVPPAPEFAAARWCFSIAVLSLTIRFGWWVAVEQAQVNNLNLIVAFLIFGSLGALWVGAMNWVNKRQSVIMTPKLALVFDPKIHCVMEGSAIQYFVAARNTGAAPVEKAEVLIEEIESLSDPLGMQNELAKYKGLPLLLKEDRHKHNDLPQKDFYVFGHAEKELYVVIGQVGASSFSLEHAEYRIGQAFTMSGLRARQPFVPVSIPAGQYRLRLVLRGSDGMVQQKTFFVSLDARQFYFGKDSPCPSLKL